MDMLLESAIFCEALFMALPCALSPGIYKLQWASVTIFTDLFKILLPLGDTSSGILNPICISSSREFNNLSACMFSTLRLTKRKSWEFSLDGCEDRNFNNRMPMDCCLYGRILPNIRISQISVISANSSDYGEIDALYKFERVMTLCLRCGLMGHQVRECESEVSAANVFGYGVWLRAESNVEVPNFFIPIDASLELDDEANALEEELVAMRDDVDNVVGAADNSESFFSDQDMEHAHIGQNPEAISSALNSKDDNIVSHDLIVPALMNYGSSGCMDWTNLPYTGEESTLTKQLVMFIPITCSSIPSDAHATISREMVSNEMDLISSSLKNILEHLIPTNQALLLPISSIILLGMGKERVDCTDAQGNVAPFIVIGDSSDQFNVSGKAGMNFSGKVVCSDTDGLGSVGPIFKKDLNILAVETMVKDSEIDINKPFSPVVDAVDAPDDSNTELLAPVGVHSSEKVDDMLCHYVEIVDVEESDPVIVTLLRKGKWDWVQITLGILWRKPRIRSLVRVSKSI